MYLTHVTLFSVLCVINEQSTFNRWNQNITDIMVHTIPGATTSVNFMENLVTYIPGNYFKNLPNLDEIVLDTNAITDVADSAFYQVHTVTKIYLRKNRLTVIREMMFSGLPNLGWLWLNHNQIHTVQPKLGRPENIISRITVSRFLRR